MRNPFIYGEVVQGEDFCDREKEKKELLRDLKSGERVFLISPRRYGKSSLVTEVANQLKQDGFLVVYLDLFKVSSLNQFLESYSQAISKAAETSLAGFAKFVKEFLSGIRPKIEIGPDGQPRIDIGFDMSKKEVFNQLNEVYDLPQKIARKRKKRLVVVLDEFQEIENLDGQKIEKAMRASLQRHNLVSYLFLGSKKHLMYNMISDRNRAFYKMANIMPLSKLPPDIFGEYLLNKFKKTGFRIEAEVIGAILSAAEGHSYSAQFICHKLWDLNFQSRQIASKDIEYALKKITEDQDAAFTALWDTLSNHQKKFLAALAKYGGENIQGAEFIRLGGLSGPSSVQTSKEILLKRDLIDKENGNYIIEDVFFKEWLFRRILS